MIYVRNYLMKWVNQLATYPRVYALMAFVFRVALAPYFFWKQAAVVRQFHAEMAAAKQRGLHVVLVGLAKPANFNFIKNLCGLMEADPNIQVFYANLAPELPPSAITKTTGAQKVVPFGVLPFLSPNLFLTPKSTLFWNRPRSGVLVHTFHSPVSLQQVYAEGSFQGFDAFFANGPHQIKELATYMPRRNQPVYQAFEVGSEIIDAYYAAKQPFNKLDAIVYGPSWGPTSSVRLFGKELIAGILDTGIQLTFRPHPASLVHDQFWIAEILKQFAGHPNFEYYDIGKGGRIAPETGALLSDWSGVAFEFALGYEKPVFFIATPQKILNQNWKEYHPNAGVEATHRNKIGRLAATSAAVVVQIKQLQAAPQTFRNEAQTAYNDLVFNRGLAAQKGYAAVKSLLAAGKITPHI